MELKGKRIAFLGDSITQGTGADTKENSYHQVFKRNVGLAETLVDGIGGTRIAHQKVTYGNEIFDQDFCGRADRLDDTADAVVVFGGTNDYGHGDAPLGAMEDRTVDTFYGACHVLMEKLITKYPDKPIVVMTPLHRLDEAKGCGDVKKPVSLAEYVHIIREVAEYYSVPVLDLFATGGMQPRVEAQNKLYFADGLHPNNTGHARIAYLLERFMKNL